MATIGRAFKISQKDVKKYGYAKPRSGSSMRPNPGVTAIAAINGRGAYAGRSGRAAHARNMTPAQRSAFASRMRAARAAKTGGSMRQNATKSQVSAAKKNIKRAIAARRSWGRAVPKGQHLRVGMKRHPWSPLPKAQKLAPGVYATNRRKSKMRRNRATPAQRLAALRNLRKARAAMKSNRRRKPVRRNKSHRKVRRNRRRVRRNAATTVRRNRRRVRRNRSHRKVRRNRSHRRVRRNRSHRRVRRNRSHRKVRRNRRRRVRRNRSHRRVRRNRRRVRRNRSHRRVRRNRSRRRVRRNRRRVRRNRSHRRVRRNRRRVRRNRSHRKVRRNRRRHRRNAGFFGKLFRSNRGAYRRNGSAMATLTAAFKAGALVTVGFAGHKVLTKLLSNMVLDKLLGAPPTPAAPVPTPPATSGLEQLQPYKSLIAGALAAAGGIIATNMLVKDVQTKVFITAGMAGSFVHTLLVFALNKFGQGKYAEYLSGDASRLSAMYGFGASIMPHYAPIQGYGEYFAQDGLGEYFAQNGVGQLGEYFESGVSGLGNYTGNPDMMQAAAGYGGYGAVPGGGNHIDPSSDLDRELTIAEAAAGVGAAAYEAAAGMGRFWPGQAAAGFGDINSLPAANTWIPGSAKPQLWAGVRPIDNSQMATAMVPAGMLNSGGNQGVFG